MLGVKLPAIDPMPPRRSGWRLLHDPTAFFTTTRRKLGDTFVVDAFGYRLFCVFSPLGVRALYALPESQASFGLATFNLLKLKLPPELFIGRRTTPHRLFAGDDVERYLRTLEDAVAVEIAQLGGAGTLDLFPAMRRLGHRLGFASWMGRDAAAPRWFDRLVPLFDRLDSANALVQPSQALLTALTAHRRERATLADIERVIGDLWEEGRRREAPQLEFLSQIHAAYSDVGTEERTAGVGRDVVLLHLGSQSNLYAGLAWTVANLLLHPALLARVRDGDDTLLEQCANESIRMAQRSITLRYVMSPLDLTLESGTYRLDSGVLVTTMLSVTNCSAAPGLDRFDPAHYDGRRLAASVPLPTRELVSTFGHGTHACPAQRFAIAAIGTAVRRLVEAFELTPHFTRVTPRRQQLGAVARAAHRCPVTYRRRFTRDRGRV